MQAQPEIGRAALPFNTILQSLITTAVSRIGPIIYRRVVRRNKVEAALRGASNTNGAVADALRDFEVVIGSSYGELTERLDRFLRELETSGIVVLLAEDAVVHRRSDATKNKFVSLHTYMYKEG